MVFCHLQLLLDYGGQNNAQCTSEMCAFEAMKLNNTFTHL